MLPIASKIFWKHKNMKMLYFAEYNSTELGCQYVKIMNQILGWYSSQFCCKSLLLCALLFLYVANFTFYEASAPLFSSSHIFSYLKSTYTTEWLIFLVIHVFCFTNLFTDLWLIDFHSLKINVKSIPCINLLWFYCKLFCNRWFGLCGIKLYCI